MRLTLRTLLAHLDRTLDTEDDAAIAAKLVESEFASKLVERVRACLHSDQLGAPAPLSTGTADDPNRIGEYLDSVLSAEQVAEVERICLESDPHLAEIAACHQVLTLVLAKPAEIPVSLRHRIYEMDPGIDLESIAMNGSFDGPAPAHSLGATPSITSAETLPARGRSNHGATELTAPPIVPVGPDDSGVSDAPTRLKDAVAKFPVGAGATAKTPSRRLSASDMADYTVRPSRVVPWLVSLALIAAFLFVGTQAFAPLLNRRVADDGVRIADSDPVLPKEPVEAESTAKVDLPRVDSAPVVSTPGSDAASDAGTIAGPNQPVPTAPAMIPVADAAGAPGEGPRPVENPVPAVVEIAGATNVAIGVKPEPAEDGVRPPMIAGPAETALPTLPMVSPVVPVPVTPSEPSTAEPGPAEPVVPADPIVVTSDGSLLLIRDPDLDAWVLGKKGDVVAADSDLICPPTFRDKLSIHEEMELTMVGPARVALRPSPGKAAELTLFYGRFLVTGMVDGRQLLVRFGDTDSVLTMPTPASVAAIEVLSTRRPGVDPEDPRGTRRVIQVLAAQGTPKWRSGNRPEVTLESGQLLTVDSGNQVSLSDVSVIPKWLDEPVEAADSLEATARTGLLQLLRGNEAIELSLREAMDFRRAEVGALAARTMLLLGRHDVYFGAEGVFSQPNQRTYWPDHFAAMVRTVDRGPESAAAVRQSIMQMDGAQTAAIYRLLWMYSDKQLASGADEKLVKELDNSNMTIRVLASENLRQITGNLLNFRPETETPARRAADIKKWEVKLRKGEIRWTKATPAIPGLPILSVTPDSVE
jgi:hypothetical protein